MSRVSHGQIEKILDLRNHPMAVFFGESGFWGVDHGRRGAGQMSGDASELSPDYG